MTDLDKTFSQYASFLRGMRVAKPVFGVQPHSAGEKPNFTSDHAGKRELVYEALLRRR